MTKPCFVKTRFCENKVLWKQGFAKTRFCQKTRIHLTVSDTKIIENNQKIMFPTDSPCQCLFVLCVKGNQAIWGSMKHSITIRDTGIKITDILNMISKGLSYYQILLVCPKLNLSDIMVTAKLAEELIETFVDVEGIITLEGKIAVVANGGSIVNITEMRKEHPRAFTKWTTSEEEQLADLFQRGKSFNEIALELGRKRGAIKLRLEKLGLINEGSFTTQE